MATFDTTYTTNLADALISQIAAGEAGPLTFTRLVLSSNQYASGTDYKALTSLAGIELSVPYSNIERIDPLTFTVEGVFVNDTVTTPFSIWNIGVYANNASGTEILFSVTPSSSPADTMPINTSSASFVAKPTYVITDEITVNMNVTTAGLVSNDTLQRTVIPNIIFDASTSFDTATRLLTLSLNTSVNTAIITKNMTLRFKWPSITDAEDINVKVLDNNSTTLLDSVLFRTSNGDSLNPTEVLIDAVVLANINLEDQSCFFSSGGSGSGFDIPYDYVKEAPLESTSFVIGGEFLREADELVINNYGIGQGALANIRGIEYANVENNIGIGKNALNSLLNNNNNIAIGLNALSQYMSSNAVAIGKDSLKSYTSPPTSHYPIAIGGNAAPNATTAGALIAIGYNAAYNLTTGTGAVAIGHEALYSSTTAQSNVAIGRRALYNATNGSNYAIGTDCLINLTTGSSNIAIDGRALRALQTGSYNVAIGSDALETLVTGSNSVAIGYDAADAVATDASQNTAIGALALHNISGSSNVSIGYAAGSSPSTLVREDRRSVSVGAQSGRQVFGERNTFIGWQAGGPPSTNQPVNYNNVTALGSGAVLTGSDQVQLGDADTTPYAFAALQERSDRRDKSDIAPISYDYKSFILGTEVVEFNWDFREDYLKDYIEKNKDNDKAEPKSLTDFEADGTHKRTRRHGGVIAQQIKELSDQLGFDFSGYQDHSIKGGQDVKSISYTAFIPPIIATIQDQNKEIERLKGQIDKLESLVASLIK